LRPAGKKTSFFLLFLAILAYPVFAEPPSDEELPREIGLFFFEELFILEDIFSLGESAMSEEEPALAATDEEVTPSEEALPGEEIPVTALAPTLATALDEESEEALPSEEILPDEESLAMTDNEDKDKDLDEEDGFDEDDFDFDAFFFEAPQLVIEVPTIEIRSLDTIFPNITPRQKATAMSSRGLRNSFVKDEKPAIVPNPELGIDLLGSVMKKSPSHLIEALVIFPYSDKDLALLDIYNALGRIEKIKDSPAILNGKNFYAFTESARIASDRNRKDISDPTPAKFLPISETIYIRLKEVSMGNLFLRGDISLSMYGITYSMTNFIAVRYFLVPIVKTERFIAAIYIEPVKEGILVYCMSGFYIPGFIADKVNLTPSINRRIEIFINWISSGLKKEETAVQ